MTLTRTYIENQVAPEMSSFVERWKQAIADNRKIVIGIHNGPAHRDELAAVAMFMICFGDPTGIEVVRTRVMDTLEKCDVILDVGGRNEITSDGQVWIDHHDIPSEKEVRDNGIQYAAAGKVAELLGMPREFIETVIYGIDAMDNGQEEFDGKYPDPLSFIQAFNADWDQSMFGKDQDDNFRAALGIAVEVFRRLLRTINVNAEAKKQVIACIEASGDNPIVELPRYLGNWGKTVCEYNIEHPDAKKIYVIFPAKADQWNIQAVPVSPEEGCFTQVKPLPKAWGGLRDQALTDKTGIEDAIFVHPACFMGAWKTRDAVLRAAEDALNYVESDG